MVRYSSLVLVMALLGACTKLDPGATSAATDRDALELQAIEDGAQSAGHEAVSSSSGYDRVYCTSLSDVSVSTTAELTFGRCIAIHIVPPAGGKGSPTVSGVTKYSSDTAHLAFNTPGPGHFLYVIWASNLATTIAPKLVSGFASLDEHARRAKWLEYNASQRTHLDVRKSVLQATKDALAAPAVTKFGLQDDVYFAALSGDFPGKDGASFDVTGLTITNTCHHALEAHDAHQKSPPPKTHAEQFLRDMLDAIPTVLCAK